MTQEYTDQDQLAHVIDLINQLYDDLENKLYDCDGQRVKDEKTYQDTVADLEMLIRGTQAEVDDMTFVIGQLQDEYTAMVAKVAEQQEMWDAADGRFQAEVAAYAAWQIEMQANNDQINWELG